MSNGILPIVSDFNQSSNTELINPTTSQIKKGDPSNALGLAIIECMDKCGFGLVKMSEYLIETSTNLNSNMEGNNLKVINIPPTTLHSYTLPGSKREIRKYPLEDVLAAISKIMDKHSTGHPKWIDKLEVKRDINKWLSYPQVTPKFINTHTELTEQIIGRYSKGLYDVNYKKWSSVRSKMENALKGR